MLRIKGTNVLDRNMAAKTRVVPNQGSSRSSKTTSLCQLFILKGLQETEKLFTITRKTGPALRATVMKDFFELLQRYELYSDANHFRGDQIYKLNGNEFAYISLDQASKLKGRKHNYVWMNEATESEYEDFTQLNLRLSNPTTDGNPNQIFLDYNPSEQFHWIYDKILPRPDATYIHSTYRDNSFLDAETVRVIEALQDTDPNYWQVYGLGLRGKSLASIYTFEIISDELYNSKEFQAKIKLRSYGLDFGFNHPTALIETSAMDEAFVLHQRLYERALTTPDLIKKMKSLELVRSRNVWADGARPEIIEDLRRAGFNVKAAQKEVVEGIRTMKSRKLLITESSAETINEAKGYKWKTNAAGEVLDEPIGINDDAMDAGRYGIYSEIKGKGSTPIITIKTRR